MKYIEKTTLFNIDKINYVALGKKNTESKKKFTIDLDILAEFLTLLKSESLVSNKVDFPVTIIFEISGNLDPSLNILFETDGKLLPQINNEHTDYDFFNVTFYDSRKGKLSGEYLFNEFCRHYIGFIYGDIKNHYSKANFNCILSAIKKIDSLLILNDSLFNTVVSNKFYPEESKKIIDLFEVEYSSSIFKLSNNTFSIKFLFNPANDIHVPEKYALYFYMYGQELMLTYDEFMSADNELIENAIVSVLKLKKMNISNISDLKNEFTLQEMMDI